VNSELRECKYYIKVAYKIFYRYAYYAEWKVECVLKPYIGGILVTWAIVSSTQVVHRELDSIPYFITEESIALNPEDV
jgi:hypothetical protein